MYYVCLNALKGEEMNLQEAIEKFEDKTVGGNKVEILAARDGRIFCLMQLDTYIMISYDMNGHHARNRCDYDLVPKKRHLTLIENIGMGEEE